MHKIAKAVGDLRLCMRKKEEKNEIDDIHWYNISLRCKCEDCKWIIVKKVLSYGKIPPTFTFFGNPATIEQEIMQKGALRYAKQTGCCGQSFRRDLRAL